MCSDGDGGGGGKDEAAGRVGKVLGPWSVQGVSSTWIIS